MMTPKLGNEAAAGIGISASCISVRYRYPYFGNGLVPALAFLFIFLHRAYRMPDSPAFRHLENFMNLGRDTPCTSKLQVVETDTPHCTPIHGCCWCHPSYMMLKNNRNTGKKLVGVGFVAVNQLPQSGIGNPAAGSVRYRWSQISPAFPSYG
jgi:hypothetical protein